MVAALLGLNLPFQVAPSTLLVFKLAGAAFLLWIAYLTFRHAGDPLPEVDDAATAPRSAKSAFRLGLFTQLSNPKIAVFLGAVFVGLVPADAPLWAMAVVLAIVFVNELVWYAFVGRVFSLAHVRAAYARAKRWVDRVFGVVIVAFGIRIAVG